MSHEPMIEVALQASGAPKVRSGLRVFICLAAAHALVDCFGSVWPMFKTLAGLDLAIAGRIATFAAVVTLALQPIFGLWADHGHRRLLVTVGVALVCLIALFGMVARHPAFMHSFAGYATLFALLFAAMLGVAMFHPPAVSHAGNLADARRSTVVAIFIAAGAAGLTLSHGLFSAVYLLCDRHTELLLIPGGAIVVWLLVSYRPAEKRRPGALGLFTLIRHIRLLPPVMLVIWLVQMFVAASHMALVFLLPDFLAARGYSPAWVNGGAMALLIAGSAALMIPVGHLADRIGRRVLVVACLLVTIAGYALLLATPLLPALALALLIFLMGGAWGSINPLNISLGQRLAPRSESLVTGVLMGWAWSVASIAHLIAGELAARIGLTPALTWMALPLLAALLLALLLPGREKPAKA